MNVYKRELKSGIKSFLIWTISIAAFIAICIGMFPEMKGKMDSVSDIFASMGAFSSAFGMDRLGLGTLLGFYSVECGTIMALGAALFASMVGTVMVGKEEIPMKELLLLHSSYLILTLCLATICFSLSTIPSCSSVGMGMGLVLFFYFFNLLANITEKIDWLKFLTPFSFTDGATIVLEKKLDWTLISVWVVISLLCLIYGFWNYKKRDLKS